MNPHLAAEIRRSIVAAARKHGFNSIASMGPEDTDWPVILMEEVGEVAHALTYDATLTAPVDNPALRQHDLRLAAVRAELIDVLAVATAWVEAIDRDTEPTIVDDERTPDAPSNPGASTDA